VVLNGGLTVDDKTLHNSQNKLCLFRQAAWYIELVAGFETSVYLPHKRYGINIKIMNHKNCFWFQGKRIVEMKKERPSWFSKNLLEKSTAQPSNSGDVKPTELA